MELRGFTVDEKGRSGDPGRGYLRLLCPDGELTVFKDQEGRGLNQDIWYKETPDGWKKTITTDEPKPETPGSHVVKSDWVDRQELLLQKDQLPPLPHADNPNGFPSLDAIPAEHYQAPRYQPHQPIRK